MPPKLGEYTIAIEPYAIEHKVPDVIKNHFGKTVPVAVKRIIFSPPATIAIFSDGSKSVVKTQGKDKYDPEKGVALAISKRFLSKKQYHTMLMAADCARVYDLLGIKGEIKIDAEKGTSKLTESAK